MEALDKIQLIDRTRHRNTSIWVNMDWGGLLSPLKDQQAALNTLGLDSIENYMAISDEAWDIKESFRNRTDEVDQLEIKQTQQIIDEKITTEVIKLAIKTTTDEYVLAVRIYDARVRSLLMAAREYAAQVEREQLAVEEQRAILAVAKEELRQDQINAQIYYEAIQRAMVEADLAKAQVDVAKANVRALMADIAAGQAEIDLIEAQVQKYVAMAEKATLQADVATIYAEIITKKLSIIKLDVGRKEIEDGFAYIQSKLDDMLAIWETRTLVENIKTEIEASIQAEVALMLTADKAQEDLREDEVDKTREAFDYEEVQTGYNLYNEAVVRDGLVVAKKATSDAQRDKAIQQFDKRTWAQILENAARKYVHKHKLESLEVVRSSVERISGG